MRARRPVVALVLTVTTAATGGAAVVIAWGRAGAAAPPHRAAATHASPAGVTPTTAAIRVDGAQVPAAGGFTVADALAEAGVALQEGHYIAAVSQRRLGPDGRTGRVYVDGRPATPGTLLFGGEQITTQPGPDLVEPTETVEVAVPPPVPTALYVGGRDGLIRIVRGRLSHEQISQRVIERPVAGHLVRRGAVALTFDDGPGQHWTRAILATLRRHDVPATFCMVGRAVVERPWLVREVVRDGHALCDHTYSHDLSLRSRPREQISLDIRRGARVITRASHGVRPVFFRAPGGKWSAALERAARDQGMTPLKWTVDPRDWVRPGAREVVRTVLQQLRPGGVILLHDGGGRRAQTLDALRTLLRKLPRLGYHFVLPPQPLSAEPAASASPAA